MRKDTAHHSGEAAERRVAEHYTRAGGTIAARRWRGTGGEIDLIIREGTALVFVEVKKASAFTRAAERVSFRQMERIVSAAAEFMGSEPTGQNTEVRFDVALMNGRGEIRIQENAFGA